MRAVEELRRRRDVVAELLRVVAEELGAPRGLAEGPRGRERAPRAADARRVARLVVERVAAVAELELDVRGLGVGPARAPRGLAREAPRRRGLLRGERRARRVAEHVRVRHGLAVDVLLLDEGARLAEEHGGHAPLRVADGEGAVPQLDGAEDGEHAVEVLGRHRHLRRAHEVGRLPGHARHLAVAHLEVEDAQAIPAPLEAADGHARAAELAAQLRRHLQTQLRLDAVPAEPDGARAEEQQEQAVGQAVPDQVLERGLDGRRVEPQPEQREGAARDGDLRAPLRAGRRGGEGARGRGGARRGARRGAPTHGLGR